MWWHDLRLAWLSVRRNPFISALIVAVIAVGVGTSVVAITLYHAKAGNPIWWKNDVLHRVIVDSRPLGHNFEVGRHPDVGPQLMIYRDAAAIYQSAIPTRSVMLVVADGPIDATRSGGHPLGKTVRFTTWGFFSMFDVPFLYGHGWSSGDDNGPAPVAVISRFLNDRLFAGENSVGRDVTFNGQPFRIIGVLDTWMPLPRFYDIGTSFMPSDDLFIPFHWAELMPDLQFLGYCQKTQLMVTVFKDLVPADCISTGLWVQLDTSTQREQFRRFLDNYSDAQREAGRFVRPNNNRIANVSEWLELNDVVDNESKFRVVLALIFLGICILNTLGLTLSKFTSAAPLSGIRRALGATRGDIMRQHLVEVILLGILGGALGIGLAGCGLRLIRNFFYTKQSAVESNPAYATIAQSLSHMDDRMILVAIGLSLLAGVLAGIYPVWRVARLAPASFLKSQ
jgi:putative ABC transport system permease protein